MNSQSYNAPGGSRRRQDLQNIVGLPAAYPQSASSSVPSTSLPSIRDLHPSIQWAPPPPPPAPPASSSSQTSSPGHSSHFLPPIQSNTTMLDDSAYDPPGPSGFERKRNRASYSCTECKRRKIRCDRNIPCQPCKKRRESYNCRMSDTPAPSEASVSRKEFNELEGRYLDLDYRFSELEKVLDVLLEAVAAGTLPSPAETNAMRAQISSLSQPRERQ